MLAAVEAGCPVVEYTPAEIKRAVVGYGRAEKHQVQQMIKLLLGLDDAAVAARRRRRAGGGDLPPAFDAAGRRSKPALERRGHARTDAGAGSAGLPSREPGVSTGRPPRMIAFLRGRVLDKQPNRVIVDVQGVGYEVHVPLSTYYDIGDDGRGGRAARPHARARGRAAALRLPHGARAAAVRAADRHQRHRSEAGDRGALGHRDARAGGGGAARRRRAADRRARASARRRRSGSSSS